MKYLILVFVFVSGAASGFYFDRWLHRPIVIRLDVHRSAVR